MSNPDPVVYLNGRLLPASQALVRPDDRGFVYADGVYEVVRFYNGRLFAMDLHIERLQRSLAGIELAGVDAAGLTAVCRQLIDANGLNGTDGIVYFQATRGAAPRKHPYPEGITPTVYANASVLERPVQKLADGVSTLLLEDIRWTRCDIKSIALLPNVMASEQAARQGHYEAFFHREGWLTEGSRTNIFAKTGGVWVTHPADRLILNGVTRLLALDLMRQNGMAVEERAFHLDELMAAREVFLCSTTSEIMPVVAISGRPVHQGKPGPETLELQKRFALKWQAASSA